MTPPSWVRSPNSPVISVSLRPRLQVRPPRALLDEGAPEAPVQPGGLVALTPGIGGHDAPRPRQPALGEEALRLVEGAVADEQEPRPACQDLRRDVEHVVDELEAEDAPVVPQKGGHGGALAPHVADPHALAVEAHDAGRRHPDRVALGLGIKRRRHHGGIVRCLDGEGKARGSLAFRISTAPFARPDDGLC